MKQRRSNQPRMLLAALCLLTCSLLPPGMLGQPTPAASSAFTAYAASVETRLRQQHRSQLMFLAPAGSAPDTDQRLLRRELSIEQLTPPAAVDVPGGMLHHWRGTAFVPGGKASEFERLLRDVNAYPQVFRPQVLQAKVLTEAPDRLSVLMRIRQRHVLTVVMDTSYDITFGRLDRQHGYSISRTTRVSEIDSPGTPQERALSSAEEHGFLWRLNSYWSYEERPNGLYLQLETVSLSRAIPPGLAWAIRPFVESVPRESLEFTLRAASNQIQTSSVQQTTEAQQTTEGTRR